MKKKRKINIQKIFSFVSFIFILVCIFWYGGRFVYFYLDSKKIVTALEDTLAGSLKQNNQEKETFKQVKQTYYFYKNADNNYVSYSNLLWRVVKVNVDNSVMLILEKPIASLAYGDTTVDYEESIIRKWLNKVEAENSGILESQLNKVDNYLVKTTTCLDDVSDVEKISCDKVSQDDYLGLLSIEDYLYTGGKSSFIQNGTYSYLANGTKEGEHWYLNTDGKLDRSSGEDIYGIRPTITLKPNLVLKSGTGTMDDPYQFENESSLFAGYVKLGEDLWRVYDETEDMVSLMLDDYLKVDGENLLTTYSRDSYYHNDTIKGSLAYYLNKTFLNSLSYQDLIIENKYANGYYGSDSNYDFTNAVTTMIDTKVALPSVGQIQFRTDLDNYFLATGVSKNSSLVYLNKSDNTISAKNVTTEANVIPCISIKKENLKVGSGALNDPYRTE